MYSINKNKLAVYVVLAAIVVAVFGVGVVVGKNQVVCKACKPEALDFSLFWDAYTKLSEHYIDPDAIDAQKAVYGAIAGMAQSVGDPYTDFFDPKQAKAFKQDLLGSFDGIGVEIGIKKDVITVIAPLKGTPGERAGLKAGDQIIQIDGKSASGMSVEEAVTLIRGKRGTQVTLTIFREGWSKTQDIKIVRETIKVHPIEWEIKNGDVAYVTIHQFDQALSSDFRGVASEILKSPAKKIVLDLRNNPGGYLEVSQDVAGWFLERGQIVTIEDFGKDTPREEYRAEGNGALKDYPTIILVNNGSASASEILAGALRDNRSIKLVGEKSFGKGSVQEVVTLQDGQSFLKITVAKWLTPKGNSISEVGLEPDVKVAMTDEDVEAGKDPQLQKALEIIRDMR